MKQQKKSHLITSPKKKEKTVKGETSSFVIIVAGGSGSRMKTTVPKQFIELNGKPILMHTIEKFAIALPEINIIVVLAKSLFSEWKILCKKHKFTIHHSIVEGGATRFHSVKNGLKEVSENSIVGIHDAARPFVSKKTIIKVFEKAAKKGNAIPAVSLHESIREVKGNKNKAVNRDNFLIIQTPQCFQSGLIKKAFLQEYQPSFTDDASVLEAMGEKINLMEGNPENIKITTPNDLIIAQAILKSNPEL